MSGVTFTGSNVGNNGSFAFHSAIWVDQDGTFTTTDTASLDTNGGSGTFYVTTGGTLAMSGSSNVTMDSGSITITNATVTTVGNTQINSPAGGVLAHFTSAQGSGHAVTFTDTSYSDGTFGAVATWSWDFGDSSGSTAQSPSHAYASAGTYTVVLTVTTSGGATSTATISVVVS